MEFRCSQDPSSVIELKMIFLTKVNKWVKYHSNSLSYREISRANFCVGKVCVCGCKFFKVCQIQLIPFIIYRFVCTFKLTLFILKLGILVVFFLSFVSVWHFVVFVYLITLKFNPLEHPFYFLRCNNLFILFGLFGNTKLMVIIIIMALILNISFIF